MMGGEVNGKAAVGDPTGGGGNKHSRGIPITLRPEGLSGKVEGVWTEKKLADQKGRKGKVKKTVDDPSR